MPYKRGVRKPYKKRVAKKSKKTTRKTGKQLVTKSQLYRAIRRNVETKFATNSYAYTTFNSGITAAADFVSVLPNITLGTNQNNRIGNSIRPLKMVIRGYVCYHTDSLASASNQDARMLGARLFVLQDKTNRSYANTPNNFNILDIGGSSSTFTGTALDFVIPHNSDMYQIYADKKMKILKPFGFTNNATPTSTNAITSFNNSMFHPFVITLTQKQLPAVLKFDESESINYPVNFAPYIALGYSDLLNKTPDTLNTQLAMEFVSTLYYEDA